MVLAYNPRPTAFVTVRGHGAVLGKTAERDDVVVTNWHTPASQSPMLYVVVLSAKLSHTIGLLRSGRVFVVNFVPFALKDAAVVCSRHAGEFVDKFALAKLGVVPAAKVDASRLSDAVSWVECELEREIPLGDHICFVGKVVHVEVLDDKASKLFHVQSDEFTTTFPRR